MRKKIVFIIENKRMIKNNKNLFIETAIILRICNLWYKMLYIVLHCVQSTNHFSFKSLVVANLPH